MKRKITAVLENHFDQIWRRRFAKDFVWNGENFISYQKIHQFYIDEHMRIAANLHGYKFQIETPNVVETYLENNPHRKAELLALYQNGVVKTTNTGYVICDTNLVGAETVIRNYLLAEPFFAEFMGGTPEIANRADAFGNSAQLPQILRQFGTRYVTSIYYNAFDDDVWVGIDGTALCVKKHAKLGAGGGWHKYAPCPACKGFGKVDGQTCHYCKGKGIDEPRAMERWKGPRILNDNDDSGVLRIGGEELMPQESTPALLEKLAEKENVQIQLGHTDVLLEQYAREIEQTEKGDFTGLKVRKSPEFNPNTTGGYVTHIRIKQRLVEEENKLLTGETLQAMAQVQGQAPQSYDAAWRAFLLCAFHDSAAGTVVDPAYDEIMELFDRVVQTAKERYLRSGKCFNGTSVPWEGICTDEQGAVAVIRDLAPYTAAELTFEAPAEILHQGGMEQQGLVETILTGAVQEQKRQAGQRFTVENAYLCVEADDRGLCRIVHKRLGVLADMDGDRRPCQWLLQSDTGSAWATLEPPYKTKDLTDNCYLLAVEKGNGWQRLRYGIETHVRTGDTVADNGGTWTVTLADGMDRLFFHADINWCTASKRLMVRFPVAMEGKDIYGIPGGWLYREPYEPNYDWNGTNGDWCAHRFGGVEGADKSVVLFNRGTPCYRIVPEGKGRSIYMTLLRSPTIPTCLHEPLSYTMKDYDGIRDDGAHSFDFALGAYAGSFGKSKAVTHAEMYCRPPLFVADAPQVALPVVLEGSGLVTHVKPAADGNGMILRITEHSGCAGNITLSLPEWVKAVYRTDMPERKAEPLALGKTLTIPVHGFEIATLRLI